MPTSKTYDELVDLLKKHYITKPSYHRSLVSFQQRRKSEGKSLKELYADLKRLAKDCNFGATFDSRLRDQLFMAVDKLPYFKFLLAENLNLETLTSSKLLDRIQTLEKAYVGESTDKFSSNNDVNKLSGKQFPNQKCKHCGFPHNSSACRFKDLNCRNCGRKGHLEKVCYFKNNDSKSFKNNKKPNRVKSVTESLKPQEDCDSISSKHEDEMLLKIDENNVNNVAAEILSI